MTSHTSGPSIIKRVQVAEGFLDGLDLELRDGLNVIIGPRGSGKTSIIELVRYCLDVAPLVPRMPGTSSRQAMSVLGDGKVTVTIEQDGEASVISRQSQEAPRGRAGTVLPLIIATNEIERIGVEPSSRLGLIDGFAGIDSQPIGVESREDELRTIIATINDLANEAEQLYSRLSNEAELNAELEKALAEQRELQSRAPELENERKTLKELGAQHAMLVAEKQEIERFDAIIRKLADSLRTVYLMPEEASVFSDFDNVIGAIERARGSASAGLKSLSEASNVLAEIGANIDSKTTDILSAARPLRQKLNEHVHGLGSVSSRVDQLTQQQQMREAQKNRLKALRQLTLEQRKKRDVLLAAIEEVALTRFKKREDAIAELNRLLGPRIKITIERSGAILAYAAELTELVRGSGVHRSSVTLLARKLSPRELFKYIENRDAESLHSVADIARDRAARIVEGLQAVDYSRLLFINVDDEVIFWLLDGTDYKRSDELSTGQRCTVVLPIVLSQPNTSLILDQPEDHLDNAFIVETLIEAIIRKKRSGQIVVASHNANIPVLGDAERVVVMGSDGTKGYIEESGRLDEPRIVGAITRIMEGGKEAFERRARFYHVHATDGA